jgi:hypothetical protein
MRQLVINWPVDLLVFFSHYDPRAYILTSEATEVTRHFAALVRRYGMLDSTRKDCLDACVGFLSRDMCEAPRVRSFAACVLAPLVRFRVAELDAFFPIVADDTKDAEGRAFLLRFLAEQDEGWAQKRMYDVCRSELRATFTRAGALPFAHALAAAKDFATASDVLNAARRNARANPEADGVRAEDIVVMTHEWEEMYPNYRSKIREGVEIAF